MMCSRWTVSQAPLLYASSQEEVTMGEDSDQLDVSENTESRGFPSFNRGQISSEWVSAFAFSEI